MPCGPPERKMKKRSNHKRIVLVAISVICAILLIVLGGVALYVNHLLNQIVTTPSDNSHNTLSNSWEDPGTTGATSDSSSVDTIGQLEDVINFMLLGQDDKDGAANGRTDTMVLCSVNTKTGVITMTSFMRDLWVTIPHPNGAFDDRMNAAYYYGGFDLLKETIKYNFGVEVEDFIMVEFTSFATVIDLLGGVDITLTEEEANYLNENYVAGVTPGVNRLTGQYALAYSRIRKSSSEDSDFNRVNRQHNVLNSIFQAYKSKPLLELLSVTEELLPYLTVTMDKREIVAYMAKLAPLLSGFKIETHRIPADRTWWFETINGKDVIVADLDTNRDILADMLN